MLTSSLRFPLVIAAAALVLLLTACSSGGSTTVTSTAQTSATPSPSLVAGPVDVTITLTDFGIQSSVTHFQVDVPYHFVVTNTGCATHELMIMAPITVERTPAPGYSIGPMMSGRGSMMGGGAMYCDGGGMPWSLMFPNEVPMTQLDEMALATVEEDDLHPGQTQTLDFTFAKAYPAGTLEFACHLPGHYELGMELPITVG